MATNGSVQIRGEIRTATHGVDEIATLLTLDATLSTYRETRQLIAGQNIFLRPTNGKKLLLVTLPARNTVKTSVMHAADDPNPFPLLPQGGWYVQTLDPANLPALVILNADSAHAADDNTVVRWL